MKYLIFLLLPCLAYAEFKESGITNPIPLSFLAICPNGQVVGTSGGVQTCVSSAVGSVAWGAITGTLSDQTDLQSALNAKAPSDSPSFSTQATFSYGTLSTVPYLDASKHLISSSVTPTELGYLSGVTSAIQTQLGTKAPSDSPSFTTQATFSYGTLSTVPYLDASKHLISSAVTPTELGYLSGVTSAIQTQLGTKAPSASPAFTTQVTFGNYHLEPCENDSGNSGTTKTLDLSTCSAQKSTLTGSVTYTLSNPVTGGTYVIKIATGAGGFTATWPVSVKWSGGTAPTITATASKVDLISLYYDGTDYFGSFTQNYTP